MIPNILTSFRFLLIPVYIIVFLTDGSSKQFCAWIFVIASLTDVLDGYIARRFNMTTKWGQLMDPLADKLMQITVIVSLVYAGLVPMWFFKYLLIMETVMILAGAFLYKNKIYIKSNVFGKLNTVLLFIVMLLLLATNVNFLLTNIMLTIIVLFSLFTCGTYAYLYFFCNKRYKKYNIINKTDSHG